MVKNKSEYLEQYRSPKWQKLRLKIFERDNWQCQICNKKDYQLQVHHRRYIPNRKVWEYPTDDLITLCENCHKEEKELMKKVMGNFVDILKIKLLSSDIERLNCSIGYLLHKELYSPSLLIRAIEWIAMNKLESNIILPFLEHCKTRNIKVRVS